MTYTLFIFSDVMFSILDILRGIGMTLVNIIYKTIDVLYNVSYNINSLNFLEMLEKIDNSPFTKIFNAFFILAFILLFLFSVWKITFKILEAENNDQPMLEIVKEIVKCGFLIFSVYLFFNTSVDLGINLSKAIYNNFNIQESTIGDKMKTAYLSINESCYQDNDSQDDINELKKLLQNNGDVSKIASMTDLENLIRDNSLTVSQISESGAFSYKCQINKPGIWNDEKDYVFNYNFLFGIVIGIIFLFSIGFAVLMLGRRQLELAFLMVISPLVIATSVGRKEQRAALYQQLASLVLQAGAMMLLIGLTSIMFNVIQNSEAINSLEYFTKIVTQTVLYLGCATLLMTGCTSLNRFIGENVSANSGRDMMMAIRGIGSGISGIASIGGSVLGAGVATTIGAVKTGKGIKQLAQGGMQAAQGLYHGVASVYPEMNSKVESKMKSEYNKGLTKILKATSLENSSNPIGRTYGSYLKSQGQNNMKNVLNKWDFSTGQYNPDYIKGGLSLAQKGINNIKSGCNEAINSIKNIGNPYGSRYKSRMRIKDFESDSDRI